MNRYLTLLPRRSHGVFSISRSSAVPPSGAHVHQPQAKRGKSFFKCSKNRIYPALMSSGGCQAFAAHTAETELKVLGSFCSKKELSLQIRGASVGVSIAALADGRLGGCRSGTCPGKSVRRLVAPKPGAWHPLLVCAQTAGGREPGR